MSAIGAYHKVACLYYLDKKIFSSPEENAFIEYWKRRLSLFKDTITMPLFTNQQGHGF
jgi:hypothetical protein